MELNIVDINVLFTTLKHFIDFNNTNSFIFFLVNHRRVIKLMSTKLGMWPRVFSRTLGTLYHSFTVTDCICQFTDPFDCVELLPFGTLNMTCNAI